MSDSPWTFEARPDSRVTNIRLGMWLFLASEAMLFGSMFSAYILLRAGAASWPNARDMITFAHTALPTVFLVLGTAMAVRRRPALVIVFGILFVLVKASDLVGLWNAGVQPAQHVMIGAWYVMCGLHWLHVGGGTVAAAGIAASVKRIPAAHHEERLRALMLYWMFLDVVWLGIIICFFLN